MNTFLQPHTLMRMRIPLLFLLVMVVAPASLWAAQKPTYPFDDPFKATVYGTPPELVHKVEEPATLKLRSLSIKDRRVPDVFSYSDEMYYSTALQSGEAPLIFIVAGTGAEHNSAKMKFLAQVFHQAGYHVVALSSPTHMNFIVSISEFAAPGYVPHDVDDLYRVMLWIKKEIEQEAEVSDYFITGYSLGALHAAFLTHKDSKLGDFKFRKTLMINPPVSLYHSVERLDSWLAPGNIGNRTEREEIDRLINKFSNYYERKDITDLDDNFLYEMVTHVDLDDTDLRTLIAVDFRVSSSSMIFASDVCLQAGYIVPPNAYPLTAGTPLMPYAEETFDISFQEYMTEFLLPYLQYLYPGMDRYELLRKCSLYTIRTYLKETDKIVLIGNRDDIILNEQDLAFIDDVFGDRATMFPAGGHCGNIMFGPFVESMLEKVKP